MMKSSLISGSFLVPTPPVQTPCVHQRGPSTVKHIKHPRLPGDILKETHYFRPQHLTGPYRTNLIHLKKKLVYFLFKEFVFCTCL